MWTALFKQKSAVSSTAKTMQKALWDTIPYIDAQTVGAMLKCSLLLLGCHSAQTTVRAKQMQRLS
jgi:hypothetical protein